MKKFVLNLVIFAVLFLGYVVIAHAWCWWRLLPSIDESYTIRPDQTILFIGSSTLGYSINEDPAYSNKVLWVSGSPLDTTFMRLAELERRGQLNHVQVLALPFSVQMLTLFTEKDVQWSWYQELPVSWRYFEHVPFGRFSLIKYILSNLRPSVPFKRYGVGDAGMNVGLMDKSEPERMKFLEMIKNEFCEFDLAKKNYRGWETQFKLNISRMLEICKKHNIRLMVYRQPLLPFFKEHLPVEAFEEEAKWIAYFKEQGITFMDIPEIYGQDVFHDHMHFTAKGAKTFTKDWFAFYSKLR